MKDERVIAPLARTGARRRRPEDPQGSLAPDGAVIKCGAVDEKMWKHEGPARVFNGEKDAMDAILKRKIQEGDVVVIRYEGPKGAPGCRRCSLPPRR